MEPCQEVDCADPALDPALFEQCCAGLEYGVEPACENVDCQNPDPGLSVALYEDCCGEIDCTDFCCDCDYGTPPPQAVEKCCNKKDPK